MKNKLEDLNNHLFEAIERLNDKDLKPENVHNEVTRGKTVAQLSEQLLKSGTLALDVQKFMAEVGYGRTAPQVHLPKLLEHRPHDTAD